MAPLFHRLWTAIKLTTRRIIKHENTGRGIHPEYTASQTVRGLPDPPMMFLKKLSQRIRFSTELSETAEGGRLLSPAPLPVCIA